MARRFPPQRSRVSTEIGISPRTRALKRCKPPSRTTDLINRVQRRRDIYTHFNQQLRGKLVEHKRPIADHGPEMRDRKWAAEPPYSASPFISEGSG